MTAVSFISEPRLTFEKSGRIAHNVFGIQLIYTTYGTASLRIGVPLFFHI